MAKPKRAMHNGGSGGPSDPNRPPASTSKLLPYELARYVRNQIETFGELERIAVHRYGIDEDLPHAMTSAGDIGSVMHDGVQVAFQAPNFTSREGNTYHVSDTIQTAQLKAVASRCSAIVTAELRKQLSLIDAPDVDPKGVGLWLGVVWRMCLHRGFVSKIDGRMHIEKPLSASYHTLGMLAAEAATEAGGDVVLPPPNASSEGQKTAMTKEARALAILTDHPEWSDADIAKAAGCSRTTLYRWERFRKAREILRTGRQLHPRGTKSAEGDIEAWDEE